MMVVMGIGSIEGDVMVIVGLWSWRWQRRCKV